MIMRLRLPQKCTSRHKLTSPRQVDWWALPFRKLRNAHRENARDRSTGKSLWSFIYRARQQILVLSLPEVSRHLIFQRRVLIVRAATALISAGLGHNLAAQVLNFPASTLCTLLKTFRERGEIGLLPQLKHKRAGSLNACKLEVWLGV
ncbi:MAG: hypothetical protein WDN00_03440 [Limisphaerales bacterium]